jgi:hypothetical protein
MEWALTEKEVAMKQLLKWAGLILLAAVVGLALALGTTALVRSQLPAAVRLLPAYPTTPYPPGQPWGYGPGMMGRGIMGPGMMGGWGSQGRPAPGDGAPLTLDQAVESARQYLEAYGNPDPSLRSGQALVLTEVMEFSENFYAEVEEKSTGVHAFELLIDRYTGAVYPEPGPNMMWNTRYGHMGGMMGGWGRQRPGTMSVTPEQALDIAQSWLDQNLPGTTAAEQADAFYGYYTIHVLKEGQVYGMLSVNGTSGEVWYHNWHGEFIDMKELEEQ